MTTHIFISNADQYKHLSGKQCDILRALTPEEHDHCDVGQMYLIILDDNNVIDAFADELTLIN